MKNFKLKKYLRRNKNIEDKTDKKAEKNKKTSYKKIQN